MRLPFYGIWGILILAADIWAIVNISQSRVSNGSKVLWILLVVLLPVIGLIVWILLGPRGGSSV